MECVVDYSALFPFADVRNMLHIAEAEDKTEAAACKNTTDDTETQSPQAVSESANDEPDNTQEQSEQENVPNDLTYYECEENSDLHSTTIDPGKKARTDMYFDSQLG